jgi:hypothetical protein
VGKVDGKARRTDARHRQDIAHLGRQEDIRTVARNEQRRSIAHLVSYNNRHEVAVSKVSTDAHRAVGGNRRTW